MQDSNEEKRYEEELSEEEGNEISSAATTAAKRRRRSVKKRKKDKRSKMVLQLEQPHKKKASLNRQFNELISSGGSVKLGKRGAAKAGALKMQQIQAATLQWQDEDDSPVEEDDELDEAEFFAGDEKKNKKDRGPPVEEEEPIYLRVPDVEKKREKHAVKQGPSLAQLLGTSSVLFVEAPTEWAPPLDTDFVFNWGDEEEEEEEDGVKDTSVDDVGQQEDHLSSIFKSPDVINSLCK